MLPEQYRKRLKAEPPLPAGDADAWRSHPRLQGHAEGYRDHPNQTHLLEVYRRRTLSMRPKVLLRHACHVGAWVAVLPEKLITESPSPGGISPLQLLTAVLQLRARSPITGWLHGILHLVAQRMSSIGYDDAHLNHWRELHRSLPSCVWKQVSVLPLQWLGSPSLQEELPHGKNMFSLKMYRARQLLTLSQPHTTSESACIADLETRTSEVIANEDADAVVGTITDIVALLSPPRHKQNDDADWRNPMPEDAKTRLHLGAQLRLRALLLTCLDFLDLSDRGTRQLLQVPLKKVNHLLHGASLNNVTSGKQWRLIAEILKVATDDDHGNPRKRQKIMSAADDMAGKPKNKATPRTPSTRDGIYTPNERIRYLAHVKQFSDSPVRLICSTCGHCITSDWYIKVSAKARVLIPHKGHLTGGGMCGKYAPENASAHTRGDATYPIERDVRKHPQCLW